MILTPDGHVARYLNGLLGEATTIASDTTTLRYSLVEASGGKIGSVVDLIKITCFHYDESTGNYTKMASWIMTAGGAFTVLVVFSVIGRLFYKEYKRNKVPSATLAQ